MSKRKGYIAADAGGKVPNYVELHMRAMRLLNAHLANLQYQLKDHSAGEDWDATLSISQWECLRKTIRDLHALARENVSSVTVPLETLRRQGSPASRRAISSRPSTKCSAKSARRNEWPS